MGHYHSISVDTKIIQKKCTIVGEYVVVNGVLIVAPWQQYDLLKTLLIVAIRAYN